MFPLLNHFLNFLCELYQVFFKKYTLFLKENMEGGLNKLLALKDGSLDLLNENLKNKNGNGEVIS